MSKKIIVDQDKFIKHFIEKAKREAWKKELERRTMKALFDQALKGKSVIIKK